MKIILFLLEEFLTFSNDIEVNFSSFIEVISIGNYLLKIDKMESKSDGREDLKVTMLLMYIFILDSVD